MRIISITTAYNEEAQIAHCIENSREHGIYPIIIDNGSTDDTVKIAGELRVPVFHTPTDNYDVYKLTRHGVMLAKEMGCDWMVWKDADELFDTYDGRTVLECVMDADKVGRNCMQFDLYEFWPTVDDDYSIDDYTKRILHYSYYKAPLMRMVRNVDNVQLTGPHVVTGNKNTSIINLVLRHYKFISLEQGRRKVKERRKRYNERNVSIGSHTQYKHFTNAEKYYVLRKNVYSTLNKFNGTYIKNQVFDGWRGERK